MVYQIAELGDSFQQAAGRRLLYFRTKESLAVWMDASYLVPSDLEFTWDLSHFTISGNVP